MHPSTETIFLKAIDLPKRERAAFLDQACGGSPQLRAAVEALLWADEHPDILTRSPVATTLANAVAAAAESVDVGHGLEGPGSMIGLYKLLEELGEGGFGRVFLAEQEQPVRRRVALKILKAGMDTRQVIGRFEAERQALALMDHPGIAKVFDAGTTSSGRPYFVMELVKGIPLTAYADQHNLTVRERLELFRDVCLAVQHAHSKGIIHRDLKPSNILVVAGDSGPEPKVIDFGIAKATGARLSDKTVHTQAASWLGTPEYMSPEQAGGGQDIDTRSDVYSLGACLYEVLVGVTPFDTLRLRSVSYDQVARMIREDEPPRPSTRLSRLSDEAPGVATKRKMDPAKLTTSLKGDLDWIVMKAIDKDPSRRYETASSLAADIQRFLENRPVEARPPSTSYQMSKWVRRNRGAFAAAVAIGAAVLLGVVGLAAGLVRADEEARRAERNAEQARSAAAIAAEAQSKAEREAEAARLAEAQARESERSAVEARAEAEAAAVREREAAQREREAAERTELALESVERQRRRAVAVETFIQRDMLGSGLGEEPLSADYTVRQMVMNAERRLDEGAGMPADFEAAIRHTIGLLFIRVGEYVSAERNIRRAIEVMEGLEVDRDEKNFADALDALGVVLNYLDRTQEAIPLHERALELRRQYEPDNLDSLASSLSNLAGAAADQGDFVQARRLFEEALEIRLGMGQEGSAEVGNLRLNLGMVMAESGSVGAGEAMLRQSITDLTATVGPRSAAVAQALGLYGEMLIDKGRPGEAIPMLEDSASIRTEIFGPTHRFVISTRTLLGRAMMPSQPVEGLAEVIAAAELAREHLALSDVYRLNAEQRAAMALYQQSRYPEAEVWLRGIEPLMREHFGSRDGGLGGYLAAYADTLMELGGGERLAEAERILRECLTIRQNVYRPGTPTFWLIESSRAALGDAISRRAMLMDDPAAAAARFAEAEPMLVEAIETMNPPERNRVQLTYAIERLIALYEAWERVAPGQGIGQRAEPLRARLAEPQ